LTEFEQSWEKFKLGLANDLAQELAINAPVDTGNLKNSIRHRINSDDITITMAEHALYVELGTPPHIIRPKNAKALHWKSAGKDVFAKRVNHPGTRPNPFIRTTLMKDLPKIVEKNIDRAFA
jgi:hypothetical protein